MNTRRNAVARSIGAALLGMSFSSAGLAAAINADQLITKNVQPTLYKGKRVDIARTHVEQLDKKIEVFVRLSEPAVTEYVNAEMKAGRKKPDDDEERRHARKVDDQQKSIRKALEGLGAEIRSSMRVGANGFRVKAGIKDLAALRLVPGVVSVAPIALHTPNLDKSVSWINAPQVWERFGDGEGIRIGIIDTGIDYLHADFGGSGDPNEYAANDKTVIEPGTFPTAKVVGGYDFAGAYYDPNDPANDIPQPDPDPLDGNGHGTHVAGIAAGMGVSGKVAPGVAKGASLYALKVFSDFAGSTALTADAIEWALDPNGDGSTADHLDVINMSLGAPFGDPEDPSAIAAQNATELGVIVVASAGNSGDTPYVTGSPAVAEDVISVAASVAGPTLYNGLRVDAPASIAADYAALEAAFTPPLSVTGPLSAGLVAADPLEACASLNNAGEVAGRIVLIQRGSCAFELKGNNAEAAGALGFVVFNNQPGAGPIVMGGGNTVNIPGIMIGNNDGLVIAGTLGGGTPVDVTLDASIEVPVPELDDTLADFSSRGPGHGGSTFKPDLAAPGSLITSALVGSGTESLTISGTSMSAPHVAGLSALMRSVYPDLEPAEIKALMQNATVPANVDPSTGAAYPLARQGTGIVRADKATSLSGFAKPGGVSFGRINPKDVKRYDEEIEIHNLSNVSRTYTVTHEPNQTFPGVSVSAPASVTVGPGKEKEIEIELRMDPALGPYDPGFYSQTEVDGWFVLSDGVDEMRVGYLAVVDPASKMSVDYEKGAARLENTGASAGFAEGFTLAGRKGLFLKKQANAISALGYRSNNYYGANNIVEFGVATKRAWETPSAYEIDIRIDADADGVYETTLVAIDLGFILGGDPSGTLVTAIFKPNYADLLFFADADLNDRTAILPFFRHDAFGAPLGFLPAGDTDFDYEMYIFDLRDDSVDVQTGYVDLAQERIAQYKSLGLNPGDSFLNPVTGGSGDMLWLFQNNEAKKQAKFLEIHN